MKSKFTFLLRLVTLLVGIIVLAALLWEPHLEGRNRDADLFTIYFKDAFLAYIYLSFVPFFCALYQVFKLLGYIGKGNTYTKLAFSCLGRIKYYLIAMIAFLVGAMGWVFLFENHDDASGALVLGFLVIVSLCMIVIAVSFSQFLLKRAS